MPSFNPFTQVTGRHSYTLFEIRLDNDFLVFRGNEHESAGQLLKGTVVLCLPAPLKVEDVHLRLTGTLHLGWVDSKVTPSGLSNTKTEKTSTILTHKWQPFVGIGAQDPHHHTTWKGTVLPAGNYEWPFQQLLPGDTTETVEGISEASITYKLKATVARGKLAYDLHTYKRLRVIRTLEPTALEVLHAMSVENIWPNKVEYSIVVPQKGIVFGTTIPLETRFTPLLKGLDLGEITIKLVEVHDFIMYGTSGLVHREYKKEKEVQTWTVPMVKEEHWQDMIDGTGQEGWVMNTTLDLPKKLGKCLQDVNAQGIKIRHKLKLVVALKNPDGHISELRATLPVTIFISPNMPLDEDGNMMRQLQQGASSEAVQRANAIAPPGYGEHILDQLYDETDPAGLRTPAVQSGVNSPFYGHSRAGSSENLAALMHSTAVTPAALLHRLQSVTLDHSHRNHSWSSFTAPGSGLNTPPDHTHHSAACTTTGGAHTAPGATTPYSGPHSAPLSAPLSRQVSEEHHPHTFGVNTPEHLDFPELSELNKVPSYKTAIKAPVRQSSYTESLALPDYQTALSVPGTPGPLTPSESPLLDPLSTIMEGSTGNEPTEASQPRPSLGWRRQTTIGFSFPLVHSSHHGHHGDHGDDRRRLHLLHHRERVV